MKRVISRFLYCIGFVSIAVNFMLPLQKLEDTDDLMNQPPEDDYLLFSTSESNKKTKLKQIRTSKNVCQVTMTMIFVPVKKSRHKKYFSEVIFFKSGHEPHF